jgi:ribosomal protein S18 acetylase RimI-like enzyme
MGSIAVRAAQSSDLERLVATVALAFGTDPFNRWLFRDPERYLAHFPRIARLVAQAGIAQGSAFVTSDCAGAALWLGPRVAVDEAPFAVVMREALPAERLASFSSIAQQMNDSHPKEEHWYLGILGVDPARQNGGLGSALLSHALERVDREGEIAYLESSNPVNVPLYERHGFEVVGEITVGGSPRLIPMLRKPR